MAGQTINFGHSIVHIDYEDGEGSAIVNGRKWRWEFHECLGPTFLRKDGEPMKRIPSEKHPVWDAFGEWLKRYNEKRKTTPRSEVVCIDMDNNLLGEQ